MRAGREGARSAADPPTRRPARVQDARPRPRPRRRPSRGALGAAGLRALEGATPVFVLAPLSAGRMPRELGLVGIRASHFRPCHFFSGFGDLRKRDEHLSVVFTWVESKSPRPAPNQVV